MTSLGCCRGIDMPETAVTDRIKSCFNARLSARAPLVHGAPRGGRKRGLRAKVAFGGGVRRPFGQGAFVPEEQFREFLTRSVPAPTR